jgi:hypothetical protein
LTKILLPSLLLAVPRRREEGKVPAASYRNYWESGKNLLFHRNSFPVFTGSISSEARICLTWQARCISVKHELQTADKDCI